MEVSDMPEVDVEEEKQEERIQVKFGDKKSIMITFQTIQDLARLESNRAELQKLDETFYLDLLTYLLEKKKIAEMPGGGDLFSSTEKVNTKLQLENALNLTEKLYDKRERKIINMAIDKSRIGSALIDTTLMLGEEKLLFSEIAGVLERFRKGILQQLKDGKMPSLSPASPEVSQEFPKAEAKRQNTRLVRFLSAVPKFVGQDLEIIGPFDEEDVANLPDDIAKVLIEKGRAEAIEDEI